MSTEAVVEITKKHRSVKGRLQPAKVRDVLCARELRIGKNLEMSVPRRNHCSKTSPPTSSISFHCKSLWQPRASLAGCYSPSQCGMACPSAELGLRLGRASTLLDPRPRRRVWRCLHPAHPGHGHSRPTGLGAVALAERICGAADRLDPTGMS
jgi:hypothetical protein